MSKLAIVRYQPSYWNTVCQATIPAGWVIVPEDGPKFGCEPTAEDAINIAKSQGYKVTKVDRQRKK